MSGLSTYPGILDTWIDQEAKKDKARAVDFNKVQDAIKQLEQYIGVNPQGTTADLATRIFVNTALDGSIRHGTSFPSSPITGQLFIRTDESTLYFYDGATWRSFIIPTNVILAWPKVTTTSSTYIEVGTVLFKKLAGINTLYCKCRMGMTGGNGQDTYIRFTVNGTLQLELNGHNFVNGGTFFDHDLFQGTIDISSLTNNTVYDILVEIKVSTFTGLFYGPTILGS